MKEIINKLTEDNTGEDPEKACSYIYPIYDDNDTAAKLEQAHRYKLPVQEFV